MAAKITPLQQFTVEEKADWVSSKIMFYLQKNQRAHWKKEHSQKCCPFKIETDPGNPERGRFVIATRDLLPGDVIIEEPPITAGPKQVRFLQMFNEIFKFSERRGHNDQFYINLCQINFTGQQFVRYSFDLKTYFYKSDFFLA